MCLTCKVDPRTTTGFFQNAKKTEENNIINSRAETAQAVVATSEDKLENALFTELQGSERHANFNIRHRCSHIMSLSKNDIIALRRMIDFTERPKCSFEDCRDESKTWLCLACKSWFCGDYFSGHLAAHTYRFHHCVIFCKDTISLWCYSCDRYLKGEESALVRFLLHGRLEKASRNLLPRTPSGESFDTDVNGDLSELALPTNLGVVFKHKCLHIAEVLEDFSTVPINISVTCQYNRCKHSDDVSICLSCAKIYCGDVGEKHMALHNIKQEKHAIHLFLHNLSIWCCSCQRFLDYQESPRLAAIYNAYHKVKFNSDTPEDTKVASVEMEEKVLTEDSDNESINLTFSSGSSNASSYDVLDSLEVASIDATLDSLVSSESSRKRKVSCSLSDFGDDVASF